MVNSERSTNDDDPPNVVSTDHVVREVDGGTNLETWKLRDNLCFTWVAGRSDREGYWVVRDPFSKDCFSVTDLEMRLLSLADGCRNVVQACRDGVQMVRPQVTDLSGMLQFFIQAKRRGLLKNVGVMGELNQLAERESIHARQASLPSQTLRWLFYRFPGFKPRSFSRQWQPSSIALTWMAGLALALVVTAGLVLIAEFDVLVAQASDAILLGKASWWLGVVLVIAALKTLHEWAHVVACRWCGAECREVGIMLLFGTPCLYCDVSDLWTVPETWKRVAVSSAGMIAEFLLAATSLLVWSFTHESTLHDLALVVAVVGSVSTVLVNANPLLRYDGYFILADWLGVPNLATQASQCTLAFWRKLVWGRDESLPLTSTVGRRLHAGWLLCYGMCSGIYRTCIVGLIALTIYRGCNNVGYSWLGLFITAVLIAGILRRKFSAVAESPVSLSHSQARLSGSKLSQTNTGSMERSTTIQPTFWNRVVPGRNQMPEEQQGVSWWQHSRARWVICLSGLVLGLLMMVPYPSNVRLPVLIEAADAETLYAKQAGQLTWCAEPGETIRAGGLIATLRDDALSDRHAEAGGSVREAKASLVGWARRKGSRAGVAARAALAKQRLEVANAHLKQVTSDIQHLSITATKSGTLASSLPASDWQKGVWILRGSRVGWICPTENRSGQAFAAQSQIQAIQLGQTVWAAHESIPSRTYKGTVVRVGQSPISDLPSELAADLVTSQPSLVRKFYPVMIQWVPVDISADQPDQVEGGARQGERNVSLPLPIRGMATAVVETAPQSGWQRLRDLVTGEILGR